MSREEFDEVRGRLVTPGEARDSYLASDRGRRLLAKRVSDVVGDAGADILRGASRVEAFRVADTEDLDYGFGKHKRVASTLGKVDGYTITSRGVEKGEDFAARLASIVLDGSRYFVSLDCLPDPGVAFRLSGGKGSVVLVIYYECDYLKVYVHDAGGTLLHHGASYFDRPEDLQALAVEAFPDDAEIQRLAAKP
jgi:hypothetical protein